MAKTGEQECSPYTGVDGVIFSVIGSSIKSVTLNSRLMPSFMGSGCCFSVETPNSQPCRLREAGAPLVFMALTEIKSGRVGYSPEQEVEARLRPWLIE